jgi:L-amino acid N-acyltransferase YncA
VENPGDDDHERRRLRRRLRQVLRRLRRLPRSGLEPVTSSRQAPLSVEPLGSEHWPAVARIYAEGIATGDATFETEVPSWERWDAAHLPEHRLVALDREEVVGWAAVVPVSDRCVYGGVVEHSVYVAEGARGRGVGLLLLERLAASTEAAGIWTIQTGIFPENEASLRLHERAGFRVVGRRERLGRLHGVWRDVLLLERRSRVVE